jgi:hypothetical protein
MSCDVYYYYRRYTTDGGRTWWRYVVHASREPTSGESSGGSKVSTDGCSSTMRRRARPTPNSSPTVVGVAGRCSGRVSGLRPLPYFPRLTSITWWSGCSLFGTVSGRNPTDTWAGCRAYLTVPTTPVLTIVAGVKCTTGSLPHQVRESP